MEFMLLCFWGFMFSDGLKFVWLAARDLTTHYWPQIEWMLK